MTKNKLHYQVAAEILGTAIDPESEDSYDIADAFEMNGGIRLRAFTPHEVTITMFRLGKSELRRLQSGLEQINYPGGTRVILAPGGRNDVIKMTVDQLMLVDDPREL